MVLLFGHCFLGYPTKPLAHLPGLSHQLSMAAVPTEGWRHAGLHPTAGEAPARQSFLGYGDVSNIFRSTLKRLYIGKRKHEDPQILRYFKRFFCCLAHGLCFFEMFDVWLLFGFLGDFWLLLGQHFKHVDEKCQTTRQNASTSKQNSSRLQAKATNHQPPQTSNKPPKTRTFFIQK